MKRIAFFLLYFVSVSILCSTVINIPEDYTTIQEGIDASEDGDEIIVSPGTYVENINFAGKAVILGSLFYTTQDTSYISQTIIDGNQDGSVFTFDSGEDSTSVLTGFTITNGTLGIGCGASGPSLRYLIITNNSGSGLVCSKGSTPSIRNAFITNNSAFNGGGIDCSFGSNLILENVTITDNSASNKGGGIYCDESNLIFDVENRCNIYLNYVLNSRGYGLDIYTNNCDTINVIVDTFTVLAPTDYYASPINYFNFNILYGIQDTLINSDLYVSVDGDDSNTGITADEPLKTIRYALSKIYADSLNLNTIYLLPGIYSSTTNGEIFPIEWSNYVSLEGSAEDETILDANNETGVMRFHYVTDASIENITIRNGYSQYNGGIYCDNSSPNIINVTITDNYSGLGGGIYCRYSNPSLTNVTISGNTASNFGGGIRCRYSSPSLENVTITGNSASCSGGGIYCCYSSSPSLVNVTIADNSAIDNGGGIYCYQNSNPSFANVTITNNTASNKGGGIYCNYNSSPSLTNVTIIGNSASDSGGGFYCSNSDSYLENVTITDNSASYGGGIYCEESDLNFNIENRCSIYLNNIVNSRGYGADIFAYNSNTINVFVDTFTVLTPTDYYASPIDNFTFDILHSIQDTLINSDLYVSVDGDNSNTGITSNDPLRTIECALSKIYTDSLNHHTIFLLPGIYSSTTNEEIFPIEWSNYVSLEGSAEEETILDGNNENRVIQFHYVTDALIKNITIRNGYGQYSGGIYCDNSSPNFINVTTIGNFSGGICCRYNSNPSLENVTITGNSGNGIYCVNSSNPSLENVTIIGNSGIGIYCKYSSNPSLENVIITGNSGGGIRCWRDSNPSLVNVTITGNSATDNGGGIYCWGNSRPSLVNCILWNDTPQEIYFRGSGDPNSITVSYSDIQNGLNGIVTNNNGIVNWLEGNIDADPLFVDAEMGDYHLTEDSPCIDTGIAYFEYNGEVLVDLSEEEYFGIAPDMGAYEYGLVNTDEVIIQNSKLNIQNYPNPFNPETNIVFDLSFDSNVLIEIYNIKGQKVTTLINNRYKSGRHHLIWNAENLSSGIYLMNMNANGVTRHKKLILLK